MPGPLFWLAAYAAVFASAVFRRYRKSRAVYDLGDAGWREEGEWQQLPGGYLLVRESRKVGGFVLEMGRDLLWFAEDILDAMTG